LRQIVTSTIRHADVDQNEVRLELVNGIRNFGPSDCRTYHESLASKKNAERLDGVSFIVSDEDAKSIANWNSTVT
jgi:hypothetical protein